MTETQLRKVLDSIIKTVFDTYRTCSREEAMQYLALEVAILARHGFLDLSGERFKRVVVAHGQEHDVLYLLNDFQEDERGIRGHGFAYNLTNPDLSGAGFVSIAFASEDGGGGSNYALSRCAIFSLRLTTHRRSL